MSLDTAPISVKSAPSAPQASAPSSAAAPQMRQASFLEKIFRSQNQWGWSDTSDEKKEEKKESVSTLKQTQKLEQTLDEGLSEKQKKKEKERVIHRLSTTALTLMKSKKDPNQAENVRCEIVQKLWEQYLESIRRNS